MLNKAHRGLFVILLCAASACNTASTDEFSGRVIDVLDGDSLIVRGPQRREHEVRLFGIDAPERHQPFADEARRYLETLVLNEPVRVNVVDVDKYDRTVARLYLVTDDTDVNASMIETGHAWVFRRFTGDRAWIALEENAREERIGLWVQSDPTAPWKYRKRSNRRR